MITLIIPIEILEFENLIQEFNVLPRIKTQPTYLELCRYPYRRFEEICSRLLCYYFAPNEDHGLKDLFLSSLLELINPIEITPFSLNDVKITNEEYSNGKYLDILIETPTIIIGIENKITAGLYNPLENYSKGIDSKVNGHKHIYKLVLSLNRIIKESEKKVMRDNNFVNITYSDFFSIIRRNIGNYINESNSKYLLYANDFLQTIENMDSNNIINHPLDDFFYDNHAKIDELIDLYTKFDNRILSFHKQRMETLLEEIKIRTYNTNWKIWNTKSDGIYLFNDYIYDGKPKLGIECTFEDSKSNPFNELQIYILAWEHKDWDVYKNAIIEKMPNKKIECEGNKTYILCDVIHNNNDEMIINALEKVFNIVKDIINSYKK